MESITNLIVRRPYGDGGRTIALNAHGDVVPPGEGWTRTPTAPRSKTASSMAAPLP
jgi:acetylornithine deacetylase/succinyl-diaminopimelate desuccinylase-like protein